MCCVPSTLLEHECTYFPKRTHELLRLVGGILPSRSKRFLDGYVVPLEAGLCLLLTLFLNGCNRI